MDYDIIIIGAGPAGLSFARQLEDTGLSIALIEKQTEKELADPAYDGREIALTHLSHRLMTENGTWQHMPAESISLIKDAKVLNGDFSRPLFFDHRASGKDNLGFMVSNHFIRKAAYAAVKKQKNAKIIANTEVAHVNTTAECASVTLKNGKTLTAKLAIAADSRFSATRRMMGISAHMKDFGRQCIVCRVNLAEPHDDTAYECFFYDRTIAILPLVNQQCSVVITLDAKDADNVLKQGKKAFERDLTERMQGRFSAMTLDTELYPYPLVAVYADKFYTQRFALVGDAAVGMHPVTAHGFNFGLRGADTLAREIKKALEFKRDIGADEVLKAYHRQHRRATLPLYLGTNTLVGLYTRTTPLAKFARKALLAVGQHLPPAKRLIMNQLTEAR